MVTLSLDNVFKYALFFDVTPKQINSFYSMYKIAVLAFEFESNEIKSFPLPGSTILFSC